MSSRPEHIAPPEIYYNAMEARTYAVNSRMMSIQTSMSERALSLLSLPGVSHPLHILDIGCGSGLSGEALTDAGHIWTGIDISPAMLGVAIKRDVEGSLICHDIGQGLPFRSASFDGCISISVIQWLCNADNSNHVPHQRLLRFFSSLYSCLKRGCRAILQFYPESSQQLTMITEAAIKGGFTGGVVIDYPHSTKAKKYFLCLMTGASSIPYILPQALTGDEHIERDDTDNADDRQTVAFIRSSHSKKAGHHAAQRRRVPVKNKEWVQAKKERQRKQGKSVVHDSKYTARKRRPKF